MTLAFKCVIDTNIVIKPFIDDPLTEKANQLFELLINPATQFFAPDLIYVECANVFCKYVRANLYTADQVAVGIKSISALPLQITSTKSLTAQAVQIGLQYGISAYDGCYVALSHQIQAPLLTLDKRLYNTLTNYRAHSTYSYLQTLRYRHHQFKETVYESPRQRYF